MIHTDGTPTIANAPRREQVTTGVVADFLPDPEKVLLERHASGIDVYVSHDPASGLNALAVREGEDDFQCALVPADKLLDAFAHPYIYLR